MTVKERIQKHFGEDATLYDVLNVPRSATANQLKKAYRKMALKYHPDKNKKESAKELFELLSIAHSVLSDESRRAVYDDTGDIDADDSDESVIWYDYWRSIFPKISQEDIQSYADRYRGSDEEKNDLLQAYERYEGDLDKILEVVVLSNEDSDVDRFTKIIEEAIRGKKVVHFSAFDNWKSLTSKAKRSKKAMKEEAEAADLFAAIRNRRGLADGNNASALSKHRKGEFDSMIGSLEAKYSKQSNSKSTSKSTTKSKTRKRKSTEPTEDEFQAIQKRLLGEKNARASKK